MIQQGNIFLDRVKKFRPEIVNNGDIAVSKYKVLWYDGYHLIKTVFWLLGRFDDYKVADQDHIVKKLISQF